jgi:S1-C subfamily serine protease
MCIFYSDHHGDGFRFRLFRQRRQAVRTTPVFRVIIAALILLVGFGHSLALAEHGPQTFSQSGASVVKVLPTWPGYDRPGFGAPPGTAPEGSGVFLSPNLTSEKTFYIITSAHVVGKATRIEVVDHTGQRGDARLVGLDANSDIALLEVQNFTGSSIQITARQSPLIGSHVCALGNPFGLGNSLSCGVVSAVNRKAGFQPIEDFIQTDAAVNPGMSGGALVDAKGHLLGMINAIYTKEADIDAGVNFAISTDLLLDVLKTLSPEFCRSVDASPLLSPCD